MLQIIVQASWTDIPTTPSQFLKHSAAGQIFGEDHTSRIARIHLGTSTLKVGFRFSIALSSSPPSPSVSSLHLLAETTSTRGSYLRRKCIFGYLLAVCVNYYNSAFKHSAIFIFALGKPIKSVSPTAGWNHGSKWASSQATQHLANTPARWLVSWLICTSLKFQIRTSSSIFKWTILCRWCQHNIGMATSHLQRHPMVEIEWSKQNCRVLTVSKFWEHSAHSYCWKMLEVYKCWTPQVLLI